MVPASWVDSIVRLSRNFFGHIERSKIMALIPQSNSDAFAAAQKAVFEEIPKVIESAQSASISVRGNVLLEAAQAFRAATDGPQ